MGSTDEGRDLRPHRLSLGLKSALGGEALEAEGRLDAALERISAGFGDVGQGIRDVAE